jgi:hypothetical protein
MTPFTSLLVLENDDMYTRFKVDRGRKDHWAMYPAPAKIPVVIEPIEGDEGDPKKGIKPSARVVRRSVLVRGRPLPLASPSVQGQVQWGLMRDGAPDPNQRMGDLLSTKEDLRQIEFEWGRLSGDRTSNPQRDTLGGSAGDAVELRAKRRRSSEMFASGRLARENQAGDISRREGTTRLSLNDSEDEGEKSKADPQLPMPLGSTRPEDGGLSTFGRFVYFRQTNDQNRRVGDRLPRDPSRLYQRPRYTADDRLFHDLLAYAPGLNTTTADIRTVVESEARSDPYNRPGSIDQQARRMIDRARKSSWRSLTLPAEGLSPAHRILFDGTGQYAWERTLSSGLREKVICDGKTLWHLYPELGLAARRSVSRHHRLAFAALVPFALPAPEDMARGADLVVAAERTVALVPHAAKEAKKHIQLHLIFSRDGALAQQQLVEMPAKKVLRREVYSPDGSWKILDDNDKEVVAVRGKREEAEAPSLKPDVNKLVVLDLPYRTPEHITRTLAIEKKAHAELTFAQATKLLAGFVAAGNAAQARDVFLNALARQEQRQIGYYVLLAAAGVNLDSDNVDMLDAHPHEPLAHYLALHSSPVLRRHASRWAASSNVWGEGILRRLGLGHALCQRWSSGKSLGVSISQRRGERQRALAYVKQYRGTALAWALLGLMQDRTSEEKDETERKKAYLELAQACELFSGSSFDSIARYERGRCLWRGDQAEQARILFADLYRQARKVEALLRLDSDFRDALLSAKKDGWTGLLRQTADDLLKKKERAAVLVLARQCWQLDDQVMARRLFSLALKDVPVAAKDGLDLYQAALSWLIQTDQREEADRLLGKLLDDPEHAKLPHLWRSAAQLARQREQPARALQCQEKALALEYANLPEVINLNQARQDYRGLLQSYAELTKALATLKLPAPAGFRARVVAVADRWRALDREQNDACQLAAQVLRTLGERELAFDYLTTPVGLRPGESDVWVNLAGELIRWGERSLADRAYESAFQRESSNAQILWDRAENLRRAGRLAQAQTLYQRLATSDWQPRFASLKTQAAWMLEGKPGE